MRWQRVLRWKPHCLPQLLLCHVRETSRQNTSPANFLLTSATETREPWRNILRTSRFWHLCNQQGPHVLVRNAWEVAHCASRRTSSLTSMSGVNCTKWGAMGTRRDLDTHQRELHRQNLLEDMMRATLEIVLSSLPYNHKLHWQRVGHGHLTCCKHQNGNPLKNCGPGIVASPNLLSPRNPYPPPTDDTEGQPNHFHREICLIDQGRHRTREGVPTSSWTNTQSEDVSSKTDFIFDTLSGWNVARVSWPQMLLWRWRPPRRWTDLALGATGKRHFVNWTGVWFHSETNNINIGNNSSDTINERFGR